MIRVQETDFDPGHELEKITKGRTDVGGVCSFVGLVRDFAPADGGSRAIESMTLEHYPAMTEKTLAAIEAEARARWPLADCLIVHRYGRLRPGDRIVLVIAASEHRDAAFEACRFLIDYLKTKAPFWKREEGAGEAAWVEARAKDDAAARRWSEKTATGAGNKS